MGGAILAKDCRTLTVVTFCVETGCFNAVTWVWNGKTGQTPAPVPPNLLSNWNPVAKRLERESDGSPASGVEFKNAWSFTFRSLDVFMAWFLIKHRAKFTSTLMAERTKLHESRKYQQKDRISFVLIRSLCTISFIILFIRLCSYSYFCFICTRRIKWYNNL
jgi:hypothetical protein